MSLRTTLTLLLIIPPFLLPIMGASAAGAKNQSSEEKRAAIVAETASLKGTKARLEERGISIASAVAEAQKEWSSVTRRVRTLQRAWRKQAAAIQRAQAAVRKADLALRRAYRAMGIKDAHMVRVLSSIRRSDMDALPNLSLFVRDLAHAEAEWRQGRAMESRVQAELNAERRKERGWMKQLRSARRQESVTLTEISRATNRIHLLARKLAAFDMPVLRGSAPAEDFVPGSGSMVAASVQTEAITPVTFSELSEEQERVDAFVSSSMEAASQEKLFWPIDPAAGISAYYHDEAYRTVIGEDHYAIDIIAEQDTEVLAPADGLILVAEDSGTGFQYIIMLHKNGYLTMYGHMSRFNADAGDLVRRGAVIGWSGGKPGTAGAGTKTTGPHLHFEVWRDNRRLDPLLFLDIGKLPSDASKIDSSQVPPSERRRSINR